MTANPNNAAVLKLIENWEEKGHHIHGLDTPSQGFQVARFQCAHYLREAWSQIAALERLEESKLLLQYLTDGELKTAADVVAWCIGRLAAFEKESTPKTEEPTP